MRVLQWVAAVSAAVVMWAIPGNAHAGLDPFDPVNGSASVTADGTLTFIAGVGTENRVTIAPESFHYVTITDENYPIFGFPGCINLTDHKVRCGYGGAPTRMFIDTGWGNDTIVNYYPVDAFVYDRIYGGGGDDVIYGGPGGQRIFGGYSPDDLRAHHNVPDSGTDQLFGGCPDNSCADGGDDLWGSSGDDLLSGGSGGDTFFGELGTDVFDPGSGDGDGVSYAERRVPVSVSLNDQADDGQAGEAENVPTGIEVVYGGYVNDTITGSYEDGTFYGNGGNDRLNGMEGTDYLYGYGGVDTIYGGDDSDYMYGGTENDRLYGEHSLDYAREYAGEGDNDTCQAEYHDENCEQVISGLTPARSLGRQWK